MFSDKHDSQKWVIEEANPAEKLTEGFIMLRTKTDVFNAVLFVLVCICLFIVIRKIYFDPYGEVNSVSRGGYAYSPW